MKLTIFILVLMASMNSYLIFNFTTTSNLQNWRVIDDVVMGGRSYSTFKIDNEGNGIFEGEVSLKNNGGFSSVRHQFEKVVVTKYKNIVIRLRGDGKNYQFRIKAKSSDYFSYIYSFTTSNEWQEITIPLIAQPFKTHRSCHISEDLERAK